MTDKVDTRILQRGSIVEFNDVYGLREGTVAEVITYTEKDGIYTVEFAFNGRTRRLDVFRNEFSVRKGIYLPDVEYDLTYTIPEPLAAGMIPTDVKPYDYMNTLYKSGRYKTKKWPHYWDTIKTQQHEAVQAAHSKQINELYKLFYTDLKTVYGWTGGLEAFGDAVIAYAADQAEAEANRDNNNTTDVMAETFYNVDTFNDLLAGYKLVKVEE
jgi:hypothetical protein